MGKQAKKSPSCDHDAVRAAIIACLQESKMIDLSSTNGPA